jgi:hypothetical protein
MFFVYDFFPMRELEHISKSYQIQNYENENGFLNKP